MSPQSPAQSTRAWGTRFSAFESAPSFHPLQQVPDASQLAADTVVDDDKSPVKDVNLNSDADSRANDTTRRDFGRAPHDASVFVASLPSNIPEFELSGALSEKFSAYVKVHHVKIIRDNKGSVCAFVQVDNPVAAQTLIQECSGTFFLGRTIRCELARALRTLYLSFHLPALPRVLAPVTGDIHAADGVEQHDALPKSLRLRRPRHTRFVKVLYNDEADAFEAADGASDAGPPTLDPLSHNGVFINPVGYDELALRTLCEAFGPLEHFAPFEVPAEFFPEGTMPPPHGGLKSPSMQEGMWEAKWGHRNDAVAAFNVLQQIPYVAISWAHSHPFHPNHPKSRLSVSSLRTQPTSPAGAAHFIAYPACSGDSGVGFARRTDGTASDTHASRFSSGNLDSTQVPLEHILAVDHDQWSPSATWAASDGSAMASVAAHMIGVVPYASEASCAAASTRFGAAGHPGGGSGNINGFTGLSEIDFPPLKTPLPDQTTGVVDRAGSSHTDAVQQLPPIGEISGGDYDSRSRTPGSSSPSLSIPPTPGLQYDSTEPASPEDVPHTPLSPFQPNHSANSASHGDPFSVFVGGLCKDGPTSWDEDKIKSVFADSGEIESICLVKPEFKRFAFAFVRYSTEESAALAVKTHANRDHDGQILRVRLKDVQFSVRPWTRRGKSMRVPPSRFGAGEGARHPEARFTRFGAPGLGLHTSDSDGQIAADHMSAARFGKSGDYLSTEETYSNASPPIAPGVSTADTSGPIAFSREPSDLANASTRAEHSTAEHASTTAILSGLQDSRTSHPPPPPPPACAPGTAIPSGQMPFYPPPWLAQYPNSYYPYPYGGYYYTVPQAVVAAEAPPSGALLDAWKFPQPQWNMAHLPVHNGYYDPATVYFPSYPDNSALKPAGAPPHVLQPHPPQSVPSGLPQANLCPTWPQPQAGFQMWMNSPQNNQLSTMYQHAFSMSPPMFHGADGLSASHASIRSSGHQVHAPRNPPKGYYRPQRGSPPRGGRSHSFTAPDMAVTPFEGAAQATFDLNMCHQSQNKPFSPMGPVAPTW